jgi:hypothetical protein
MLLPSTSSNIVSPQVFTHSRKDIRVGFSSGVTGAEFTSLTLWPSDSKSLILWLCDTHWDGQVNICFEKRH